MKKDDFKYAIATQVFNLCRKENIQCRGLSNDTLEINYRLKKKKRIYVRVFDFDKKHCYIATIETHNNCYGVSGEFNTIADTIFYAIKKENLNLFYKGANK